MPTTTQRTSHAARLNIAEAVAAKSQKGKAAESEQKRSAELARQLTSTGPYGAALNLQRAAGNHAVGRVLQASTIPTVQTKLRISQPGDQYEQEADQVADLVVARMPVPGSGTANIRTVSDTGIQRKCVTCEEDERLLRRKPLADTTIPLVQRRESEDPLSLGNGASFSPSTVQAKLTIGQPDGNASSGKPIRWRNMWCKDLPRHQLPFSENATWPLISKGNVKNARFLLQVRKT